MPRTCLDKPKSILDTTLVALEQQSAIMNGLCLLLLFSCHLGSELDTTAYDPMRLNLIVEVGTWICLASMGSKRAKLLGIKFRSIAEIVVPVHITMRPSATPKSASHATHLFPSAANFTSSSKGLKSIGAPAQRIRCTPRIFCIHTYHSSNGRPDGRP